MLTYLLPKIRAALPPLRADGLAEFVSLCKKHSATGAVVETRKQTGMIGQGRTENTVTIFRTSYYGAVRAVAANGRRVEMTEQMIAEEHSRKDGAPLLIPEVEGDELEGFVEESQTARLEVQRWEHVQWQRLMLAGIADESAYRASFVPYTANQLEVIKF